jgi:biotin operon repressor
MVFSAHRTTIPKDIEDLMEFGFDIETISSSQKKYFIASRKFELSEIKLMIDAVESYQVHYGG